LHLGYLIEGRSLAETLGASSATAVEDLLQTKASAAKFLPSEDDLYPNLKIIA